MNGGRLLIMRIGGMSKSGTVFGVALAALTVSACATVEPYERAPVASSPAAERVQQVSTANLPYPRWSEFPAPPENVPTLGDFATRVGTLEREHAGFLAEAQAIRWTLTGSQAWAAAAKDLIDLRLAKPAPPDQAAQTEAYAQQMRALATPPPPAK